MSRHSSAQAQTVTHVSGTICYPCLRAGQLLFVASQYHLWSRLSSGSVFSPEFPRAAVIIFNWAFGGIIFRALLQLLLDGSMLFGMLVRGGGVSVPDGVRYSTAAFAAVLAAIGLHQAVRVPPVKNIELGRHSAIPLPGPVSQTSMSRTSRRFVSHLRRWRRRGTQACQKIAKAPRSVRIAGAVAVVLATGVTASLIYQVVRKPAELFFFVGHKLDKEPAETWHHYGQLFRTYATRSISWPRWLKSRFQAIRWIGLIDAGSSVSILSRSISRHPAPLAYSK